MAKALANRSVRIIGVAVALMGLFVAGFRPVSVSAYGTQHLYEITVSATCANIPICYGMTFGVSGLWGWLELDSSYMADGSLEIQGHQNAGSTTGGQNATLKSSSFEPWKLISCSGSSPSPDCVFLSIDLTPPIASGQYFDVPTWFTYTSGIDAGSVFPEALPILIPAAPGKYSLNLAPGIRSQMTVTQLP